MKSKRGRCLTCVAGILTTLALNAQTTVTFRDQQFFAMGSAALSVGSNGLTVFNLGSSGQDGVGMVLYEVSRTATVQFSPVNLAVAGSGLAFGVSGMVNDVPGQSFGKLSLQRNGGVVELRFDAGQTPVATTLRLEVYNQDVLVGSATVPAGGLIGTLSGAVNVTSLTVGESNPSAPEWTLFALSFTDLTSIPTVAASGNRLRIVALNPTGNLQNLLRLDVVGRNLDSVIVEDVTATQFQPRLRIAKNGPNIKLDWDTRSATLFRAPTVNGPWRRMLEGTNLAEFPPAAKDKEFYSVATASTPIPGLPGPNIVWHRNVLIIIADDFGVDQCPWYINYYKTNAFGSDDITYSSGDLNLATSMPVVEKLATAGVTFLNAWSSPVCSPTRAGLYTGNCSFRHGIYLPLGNTGGLPAYTTTIADVLKKTGYTCGLFGKWHCGEDPSLYLDYKEAPRLLGFDYFAGTLGGTLGSYLPPSWNGADPNLKIVNGKSVPALAYATIEQAGDALNWIKSQTGPWMAALSFNTPHSPWDGYGPEYYNWRGADTERAYYRSMVEGMDIEMGRLLNGIPQSELEKTTIIFLGDNGTPIEKGTGGASVVISEHFSADKCKDSVYEGGVNVPLIIADGYYYAHPQSPNYSSSGTGRVVSPGRVETALVQSMDVFATAAEIGRGDATTGRDSISMVPYLSYVSAPRQRDSIFAEARPNKQPENIPIWTGCESEGWNVAIRGSRYKLIVNNYDSGSETYELYDLEGGGLVPSSNRDRWEHYDLIKNAPLDYETESAKLNLLEKLANWLKDYTCE